MSSHLMYECIFVLGCIALWLRGEGRSDCEVGLRMNHIITLKSIEFSVFYIYYTSMHLSCM